MQSDCVYCKIIKGELPCHKLYEDDMLICILDIFPKTIGHALIIPKVHIGDMFGLAPSTAEALMPLAQRVAGWIMDALACDGLNVLQNNGKAAGQVVPHYHMHLIPRYDGDESLFKWDPMSPTSQELAAVAADIVEVGKNREEAT